MNRLAKIPALTKETLMATFAMGCFWTPDAIFGSMEGVIRTRVGYAGGTTLNPGYWRLADHIETIQLDYDPDIISYQDLLCVFFSNHKAIAEPWKRQYASAVFYHTKAQQQLALQEKEKLEAQLKQKVYTEIYPYEVFYLAEDRHQKYKLQRQQELMEEFKIMYPDFTDFINSTAAARVNGYLYGYGSLDNLNHIISSFLLSPAAEQLLSDKAIALKKIVNCSG